MLKSAKKLRSLRFFIAIILSICIATLGSFAAYALQSITIPLEIKEPLEILEYPSGFSLYPGETVTFDITVQNHASVTYFAEFDFRLNDTEYQTKYVTFSNHNYSIPPGIQKLSAWLTIASTAPPANLMITINRKTDTPTPSPSPTPSPTPIFNTSLTPSLKLLGGGARWASPEGKYALYVNHKDNWETHHLTDGVDWDPWFAEVTMDKWRSAVGTTLEQAGFEVTFEGDVPEDLSGFDLVVFEALWAVEPKHEPLVRDYLSNGCGVVVLAGVPCYFEVYCKDRWPYRFGGTDLSSFQDWFGARTFANTKGNAKLAVENPFGTQLASNEIVYSGSGSEKAVTALNENAQAIALWESGLVFAFIHEFNEGRVYYQGEIRVGT
jgi:hypothetical protein